MKMVIDVDALLEERRTTPEEHERLKALALKETGSLAFNLLIGFGVIATAAGALALLPTGETAILMGLVLSVGGGYLSMSYCKEWGLLGIALAIVRYNRSAVEAAAEGAAPPGPSAGAAPSG